MRMLVRIGGIEVEAHSAEELRAIMEAAGEAPTRRVKRKRKERDTTVEAEIPPAPMPLAAQLVEPEPVKEPEPPAEAHPTPNDMPRFSEVIITGRYAQQVADAAVSLIDDEDEVPAPEPLVHPLPPAERVSIPWRHVEVAEILLAFPEGISSRGVATLMGINHSTASQRLAKLRDEWQLAQRVQGRWLWVATDRLRRAQLIAG